MNSEHVALVRKGWWHTVRWQNKHPEVQLDLSGADLRGADLSRISFFEADLSGADLTDAKLPSLDLRSSQLTGACLRRADLTRANLCEMALAGVDLSGADLSRANLRRADLRGANLAGAVLSDTDFDWADLAGADLSGTRLKGAENVGSKTLAGAILKDADLSWCYLDGNDLSEADLTNAVLQGTHLERANLIGANLTNANLEGTFLSRADLTGAILTGAKMDPAARDMWDPRRAGMRTVGLGALLVLAFAAALAAIWATGEQPFKWQLFLAACAFSAVPFMELYRHLLRRARHLPVPAAISSDLLPPYFRWWFIVGEPIDVFAAAFTAGMPLVATAMWIHLSVVKGLLKGQVEG